MQKTYVIVEGPDKTLWVPIQPLIADIKVAIDTVMALDTSKATAAQQDIVELRLMGLRSIQEFLSALVTEHQMTQIQENGLQGINTNLVDTPITKAH